MNDWWFIAGIGGLAAAFWIASLHPVLLRIFMATWGLGLLIVAVGLVAAAYGMVLYGGVYNYIGTVPVLGIAAYVGWGAFACLHGASTSWAGSAEAQRRGS